MPGPAMEDLSFRNIPDITNDEINAIEALKTRYGSFTCAVNLNTDSFYGKGGEPAGFAIMFYEWLSGFFGITFRPVFYEWSDLINSLPGGSIDFTIELTETPELLEDFFISSPIAKRPLRIYRIEGSEPLEAIINSRTPRYAFPAGMVIAADTAANTKYDFETIFLDSHAAAYPLLKSGEIDAYIALDSTEAAFDEYGNVTSEVFFPMIFNTSCLLTGNAELEPIITVLDKALDEQAHDFLAELRKVGYQKYLGTKLYALLTEEERAFIKNNPVVPFAAEFSDYPVSFFDIHTNQWQGIYFDALGEIANMTGMAFECVNEPDAQYPALVAMLERGEALILSELFHIKEYEGRFLWSDVSLINDNYAFITRSDFHNLDLGEIPDLRIGIRKNTHYSELFREMLPAHRNFTEYDTQEETWDKLKNGEIDALFSSRRRLVIYANYNEEAGFKLNLILDRGFDTSFGFNKNAALLKSIVDKALRLIRINNISNQWMNRYYDYRVKLAAAQRPWLIGAAALSFLVLLLVSILLARSRNAGRVLENMVRQRTSALAFETSKLRAVIDSIPDLMFCKDTGFRYTQCNEPYEKFIGVSEPDLQGKDNKDITLFSPEETEKINCIERIVIDEDRILSYEQKYIMPLTGKEHFFETVKAPIRQDGVVVGIIAIIRDITQRKTMEEEVLAASRAKSAFLANMSHEIRTPLNVVIGLTDLLMEDEAHLTKHVSDNLLKINSAGSTLLSLVNDILDFSKIESGKLTLSPVEYYTSSLINDVITLVIARLEEKPIKFHLDINDDLPNKLYGDDLRVKQILTNLLTNSVKYTHEGSIELGVRCTREDNTVWMGITVSDTGIGIREENLKELFLDYYQVDSKANRNIEGTGLGLPITKRLVDMMDGEINVESEYGKGTTFSLRFRQGFVDDAILGPEVSDKLRNFCFTEDIRVINKKLVRLNLSYARVLVVDDMETNLDVASGILGNYKIQIDCLTNGPAAIERIREGTPVYNAVFMDHMMPGMDGIETAERIRALGTAYAKKIPIIALTANAIQGTEEMFYGHGFQAFISKPIDIMGMDTVIRKWVRDDKHEDVPIIDEPSAFDLQIENMAIEIPGVDTKKGLSLYAGARKVYLPLLRSYTANTPEVLDKLRIVSAETLPDYVVTVHGLKGTSGSIGAEVLRETALNLEMLSRAGDLQGVLALNGKLIADAETLVANIKAWLRENDIHKAKPRLKAPDKELLAMLLQSCDNYDIEGIDKAMSGLESADYEEGADLVEWLKKKIGISKISEVTERLKSLSV